MTHCLLNNTYCYACRLHPVMRHPQYPEFRICSDSDCSKVQDFILNRCPHPECHDSQRVPTYMIADKTPCVMLDMHYFCTEQHRDSLFQIPDIFIYLDSDDTPLTNHSTIDAITMGTTADELIKRALIDYEDSLDPENFVLAVDTERRIGAQTINVLKGRDLIYNYAAYIPGAKLIIFEYAEFMQPCNELPFFNVPDSDDMVFEMPEPISGDELDELMEEEAEFFMEDKPIGTIKAWLVENGITPRPCMFEVGSVGPKVPIETSALVVVVREAQINQLFAMELKSKCVCPYYLRKEYVVFLLSCNNDRAMQTEMDNVLGYAFQRGSTNVNQLIIDYQRKYGCYDTSVATLPIVPVEEKPQRKRERAKADEEDDEEEEYETKKSEKKNNKKSKSKSGIRFVTGPAKKGLRELGFTKNASEHITIKTRPMAEGVQKLKPFLNGGLANNKDFYVFAPILVEDAARITFEPSKTFLTEACYDKIRLACFNCGPDAKVQKRALEELSKFETVDDLASFDPLKI